MSATLFISYGYPDEAFAAALHDSFRRADLDTFFFKPSAIPGTKLHHVMRDEINSRDYTILICSKGSLDRPGVVNEIEECLQKEARLGGRSVLIPLAIDRYVFDGWSPEYVGHAQAIRQRVIADFIGATVGSDIYNRAVERVIDAVTSGQSFVPKVTTAGGKYVSKIEDSGGHLARLIYSRKIVPLVDNLDYLEVPDLTSSGKIDIVGCNIGVLKEILNDGGAKRLIFSPNIELEKGTEYEMSVEMVAKDCYLDAKETTSFFTRYAYPYIEIEVFLPPDRPAIESKLVRILGPRRTNLPDNVTVSGTHLFVRVVEPRIGATYLIEWLW